MDRKTYLLNRFFQERLTDEETKEFEEYARTDKDFRMKMIRVIELHGYFEDFFKDAEKMLNEGEE